MEKQRLPRLAGEARASDNAHPDDYGVSARLRLLQIATVSVSPAQFPKRTACLVKIWTGGDWDDLINSLAFFGKYVIYGHYRFADVMRL
ncbi:hypothetical protein J1614_001940 [Plenodomus biglobosus]|nr:hypothetical protein J1614_001940 [Plenodomus biglobosus]